MAALPVKPAANKPAEPPRTLEQFLAQQREIDLLRFITCGSVDDGKSTLIGRLLHDARAVFDDQARALEADSRKFGTQGDRLDFALLVDGLASEREQGITIDVAYRFFSTDRRTFIVADTPGHEQYTRNMATGASTADVAILLVDARHGVRPQSRRHAQIARLLGIRDYVLAVNKMDLVDFDRSVFDNIVDEFDQILAGSKLHPIPISALHGDNVIAHSDRTPWFDGQPLLEFLETVEVEQDASARPFRFPVQLVLRPTHEFRGYAGQILSGSVRPGDIVTTWPTGRSSRVRQIVTLDGELDVAHAGQSITLTLEDEIDISRGDMITVGEVHVSQHFRADVVWMDERPLDPSRVYVLKHTTRTVTAELDRSLSLNQIGSVQ